MMPGIRVMIFLIKILKCFKLNLGGDFMAATMVDPNRWMNEVFRTR
jgi:hypothetical protein